MTTWFAGLRNAKMATVGLVLSAVGIILGVATAHGTYGPYFVVLGLDERIDELAKETRGASALAHDRWMIVVYGLVLVGFALFFRARASSHFGCLLADFVIVSAVLAVSASVAENVLLSVWTRRGSHWDVWPTATAATATVAFCAFLVATVGIPASAAIAMRGIAGGWRAYRWRVDRLAKPRPRWFNEQRRTALSAMDPWWVDVLMPPSLPKPVDAKAAVKHAPERSGLSTADLVGQQQAWIRAYDVPEVNDLLEARDELQALCLSGGGVRSACVAMGAMQIMSDARSYRPGSHERLIDDLDYVISVSGGGYAAGARLLAIQPGPDDAASKPSGGQNPGSVDSLVADDPTARATTGPKLSQRFEDGSAEFDHFRRGSSYIADSPASLVGALGDVLKNLVASLLAIFTIPVIIGWAVGYLLARVSVAAFPPVPAPAGQPLNESQHLSSLVAHPAAYWALGFSVAATLGLLFTALVIEWLSARPRFERWRVRFVALSTSSAAFTAVIFVVTIALPALMRLCWWAGDRQHHTAGSSLAALSGVVGLNYVAALVAIAWRHKPKLKPSTDGGSAASLLKRVLPPAVLSLLLIVATLTVLLILWMALLGSFAAGVFQYSTKGIGPHLIPVPHWQWWISGLAFTAVFIGFADVTSLSLHPLYRRKLARTFAVRRVPVDDGPDIAERYPDNEPTFLHDYGRVPKREDGSAGPRFVFACAATITGDDKPAPGLNAVSYVLSADHVGGPELGWFDTEKLFNAAPPRVRRDLTVQAAIAISGAAFASSMGRMDKGIEKLLAVSGARLGSWLPNPGFVSKLRDANRRVAPEEAGGPKPKAGDTSHADDSGDHATRATPVVDGGDSGDDALGTRQEEPSANDDAKPPAAATPSRAEQSNEGTEISEEPLPPTLVEAPVEGRSRVWPKSLPSVRGVGYLYREILGINEKHARLVQVTDGGHYDNSGLVEALRRRCRLIICIDGGGDPPPLASGLTDALRLAKYELGVTIDLKEADRVPSAVPPARFSLQSIAPGSGAQFEDHDALVGLNSRIAQGSVVTGEITYPAAAGLPDNRGRIIYAKAVLAEACPYWLKTYAANSAIFPHDPTADQWFNEGQFAAYTELGRILGREVIACADELFADRMARPSGPDTTADPG